MAKRTAHSSHSSHQRGIWSGAISFGLVNINVRVVSAKDRPELHFSMLDPEDLSPIGYKYYNKSTGEDVKRGKSVKGYEIKKGQYVLMTDADFKRANPKATQTIDIENFVELSEIDPVFYDKAYYLLPSKGGEKGYALLCDAMRASGKVAIAKIIMHTRQHLVAMIPRGKFILLEVLHFAEDVKELRDLGDWNDEVPKTARASREVKMAEELIQGMTSKWKPTDYKDTYREDIMKMVKAKVKAGKATEINEDFEDEKQESSKVVDLMPLLKKSLESKGRKAPARTKRPAKKARQHEARA